MDFVTISLPKLHRLAYLTFFFKFILFLFPFRQEFSCSCLTDRVAEHPNRFSPISCHHKNNCIRKRWSML